MNSFSPSSCHSGSSWTICFALAHADKSKPWSQWTLYHVLVLWDNFLLVHSKTSLKARSQSTTTKRDLAYLSSECTLINISSVLLQSFEWLIPSYFFFYRFMYHSSELSLKTATWKKYLNIFKLDKLSWGWERASFMNGFSTLCTFFNFRKYWSSHNNTHPHTHTHTPENLVDVVLQC